MVSPLARLVPVTKRSAEMQATDALRQYVLSGAAQAGVRLTELKLAEQLNLSRATIRAALHRLENERLVVLIPYTGWEVLRLSAQDAWELYTLRSCLEALAARLAAKFLDEPGHKALQLAFKRLAEACRAGTSQQTAELDFALHKTIVDLARHGRLREQYRLIEQQVRFYIKSSDALISEANVILAQHQPMVEAILTGDSKRAARFAHNHNESEGKLLVRALKKSEAEASRAKKISTKHSKQKD